MSGLVMVLGLFAVTILAVVVGERTQLPYPILLLLAVAGLSFLPVLPRFAIDPEIILPLFLPPPGRCSGVAGVPCSSWPSS